jgi:hypothetical protein
MKDELLRIEHELGTGDGDACIAAMDQSPGWEETEISDARVVELGPDAAALTYRWRSRRGDATYEAAMSSVYVRREGRWQLALHQQTPDSGRAQHAAHAVECAVGARQVVVQLDGLVRRRG